MRSREQEVRLLPNTTAHRGQGRLGAEMTVLPYSRARTHKHGQGCCLAEAAADWSSPHTVHSSSTTLRVTSCFWEKWLIMALSWWEGEGGWETGESVPAFASLLPSGTGNWEKIQDAVFQICEARAFSNLKLLLRGLPSFCCLGAQFLAVVFG